MRGGKGEEGEARQAAGVGARKSNPQSSRFAAFCLEDGKKGARRSFSALAGAIVTASDWSKRDSGSGKHSNSKGVRRITK